MAAGDEDRAARALSLGQAVTTSPARWDTIRRWFGWFDERSPVTGTRGSPPSPRWSPRSKAMRAGRPMGDIADRHAATSERGATRASRREPGLLARHGIRAMVADVELAARLTDRRDPWRVAAVFMLGSAIAPG